MGDERGGGQVAGARAVEHISVRGVFLTPDPPNARDFQFLHTNLILNFTLPRRSWGTPPSGTPAT